MRPAAAAAVVFLLLTAAAGTSAALSPATLLYRWQSWAQSAEEEALEGRRQPSERPAAPVLSLAQPSDGQPAVLHVSLQLPNHQLLEVHEHSSLEDIVTKLLSGQGGPLPTGLELEVVQRTSHQRTSTLGAALRAATLKLARLGSDWIAAHLPEAGGGELLMPEAAMRLVLHQHPASADGGADTDTAPGSASQRRRPPAIAAEDSATFSSQEQRLPLAAFDDAYQDAEASPADTEVPWRRQLQQSEQDALEADGLEAAAVVEDVAKSGETGWPAVTLFGARRASSQQQLPDGEAEREFAAAGQLLNGGVAAVEEDEAGDEEAPVLIVQVNVSAKRQQPAQHRVFQLRYGDATAPTAVSRVSLLRQLVAASRQATREGAALGRHGAGGDDGAAALLATLRNTLAAAAAETDGSSDSGDVPVGIQLLQQPPQWVVAPLDNVAEDGSITAETVDDMFCGALMLACVCVVLLVADIRRHGWRRSAAKPASPAVVVAAHETATSPHNAKLPI
ncbi:hypothetical protein D9Q98_007094 [Chlorella vulgaris]|uniref:Uncharacterized protein n=1 Tax=Chlorella vulgaris TaxID=3077 RepID=A0A9D4YUG8_CHLVU|nr:hypothetical protein D9Q98_007094 [Chlorella vulgaris]